MRVNTSMLLEMAVDAFGDRVAFGSKAGGMTYQQLLDRAQGAAAWLAPRPDARAAMVDVNSDAVPILFFGSGMASRPFVPINYRLSDEQLGAILARTAPAAVVIDAPVAQRIDSIDGIELVTRAAFLDAVKSKPAEPVTVEPSPDDIAVLLFTSGTTGEPKAAVLRHKHLVSYVISTVEFMGADEDEAALVSVPPYHIAGISAILTAVYAGRRVVQLPTFDAKEWVTVARDEAVTQAMVVPTMLGRILDVLEAERESLPALRHLSYGGGRMPVSVVERALQLLPQTEFVNAYGLTETASTIAVLGPEDHRVAFESDDPKLRRRLGSVGRPLPTVDVEIRDPLGVSVPAGEPGEIWVRGEQVAGEYLGRGDVTEGGWFPTKDAGVLDDDGYLYVEGRLDDVIVRGGENMSPGEIEDVLVTHPAVHEACVCGVPDTEWGERVIAVIVPVEGAVVSEKELQDLVRSKLRSSRTPERIEFRTELPYNETGKLLRRVLRAELAASFGETPSS